MMKIAAAVVAVLMVHLAAEADTVTLRGSTIPLRNCQIRDIKAGRVYFVDGRGRRQYRELDEIQALGFEGLPELAAAERLIAAGDLDAAEPRLLEAMLNAEGDLPRLWVRVRLAKTHGLRGEYVQAAGHAAAAFLLDEDSYWRHLEPIGEPNRPGYPAAREAMESLREARRKVTNHDLAAVVDRLIARIGPIHRELEAAYDGPAIKPRSTLSGVSIEEIRRGIERSTDRPDRAGQPRREPADEKPSAPPALGPRQPRVPQPGASGESAETIDALIEAHRTAEALALCQRLAREPGPRSLSRFLFQYGRCLAAEGRPRDAAVMFMRCAVLFESSEYAAPSLVETAVIYRDTYGPATATRRLLQHAADLASRRGQTDVVDRANGLLAAVSGRRGRQMDGE